MTKTLSIAEQRRQARTLLKERLAVSSDLAEEISRRLTNDVIRLLLAETSHNRSGPAVQETDGEDAFGDFDDIIDIPELADEPPELNEHVETGAWVPVTITDPITVRGEKVHVRGISLQDGETYRFWDAFNTGLGVAMTRLRRLRAAVGHNPTDPFRRSGFIGKAVMVKYELRDNGKTMVQDYRRVDPSDNLNEG